MKTDKESASSKFMKFFRKISNVSAAVVLLCSTTFVGIEAKTQLSATGFDNSAFSLKTDERSLLLLEGENPEFTELSAPQANYPSGTLILGSFISLSCETSDAEIYYSLDGSDPDATSTLYNSPIEFTGTVLIVKAVAFKDDEYSAISTFNYTWAKLANVQASLPTGSKLSRFDQVTLSSSGTFDAIKYQVTKHYGVVGETTGAELVYNGALKFETADFPVKVVAYATKAGYADSDPTTFTYTLNENSGMKVYFGQLHSHTNLSSDARGSVSEAFDWAKRVAKLDFFAVTDHSQYFDSAPSTESFSALNLATHNANVAVWKNGKAVASATTDASFVGIFGFEMSYLRGNAGHINTFNTNGFVSRKNNVIGSGRAGLQAYYQLLKNAPDSISQFNHPGPEFGDFYSFGYLDPIIDKRFTLIEIGNGEFKSGGLGYLRLAGAYELALLRGWHVGPTNSQDNHYRNWGTANDARTAILTDDFSKAGVYEALRNRQVYSTEDKNLEIYYYVNDNPMGTILPAAPLSADFSVDIIDPDASDRIARVTIIGNGKTVFQAEPGTQNYQIRQRINNPQPGYYYIKVVQADGDIAITAPVWLGEANINFIAANSIVMNTTSKTVYVGTPYNLKAVLSPLNNTDVVQWMSSNRDVAVVDDDGRVIAIKPGKATITAHLSSGKKASCSVTVSATPLTPNLTVSSNSGTARFDSLKVNITPGTNADNSGPVTGYEIYRSTSSTKNFALIATISNPTTYTVNSGLASNTTYYYKVRAYRTVNGTKYYSGYSSVKSGKTDAINPPTPSLIVAKSTDLYQQYNTINLSYSATITVDMAAIDGYEVYRSTSKSKGFYLIANVVNPTSFTSNTNLNPGTTYYYKVRAYRLLNGKKYYSPYSTTKSAKTTVAKPNKPSLTVSKNLDSRLQYNTLELSYVTTATVGTMPPSGYEIYRSTNKSKGYTLLASVNSPSEYTANSGLTPAKLYYYKVRSFNIINGKKYYSAYSLIKSNRTVAAGPPKPQLNTLLSGTDAYTQINISYHAAPGATAYKIYRSTSAKSGFKLIGTTADIIYKDSSLVAATAYYYKVIPVNRVNGIDYSGTASSVVKTSTAKLPVVDDARATSSGGLLNIAWDNTHNMDVLEIYYATTNTSSTKWTKLSTNTSSYNISGLSLGKRYYVKFRYVHINGSTSYSSYSTAQTVTIK